MRIDFLLLIVFITLNLLNLFSFLSTISSIAGLILTFSFIFIVISRNKNIYLFKSTSFYCFILIAIIAFFLNEIYPTVTVYTPLSMEESKGWSNENLRKLLSLMQLIILSVLISNIVDSSKKILIIYSTILTILAILSLILILENFGFIDQFLTLERNGRITIRGISQNDFSYLFVCAIIISTGLFKSFYSTYIIYILVFLSLLFLSGILLTASLTSIISLAIYPLLLVIKNFSFKKISSFLLIFFILISSFSIYKTYHLIFPQVIVDRIEKTSGRVSAAQIERYGYHKLFSSRGAIWRGGFSLASESLLYGNGFSTYKRKLVKHIPNDYDFEVSWRAKDAHNLYLDILLSIGIVGLIFYVLFIIKLLYQLNQTSKNNTYTNYSSLQFNLLLISLIFGTTHSIIFLKFFWIIIGLSFATILINQNIFTSQTKLEHKKNQSNLVNY